MPGTAATQPGTTPTQLGFNVGSSVFANAALYLKYSHNRKQTKMKLFNL